LAGFFLLLLAKKASQCSVHYESSSDSEDQQRAVEAESYIQSLTWLSKRRLRFEILRIKFENILEPFSALFTTSFLVNMDRRGRGFGEATQKVTGTPKRYPNIVLWV